MNKKEILFLWDGENWNPNGDMLKDNDPRRDELSDIAEVTDVRIKRTIRDELLKSEPESIFVKEYQFDGNVLDAKNAIRQSIDVTKSEAEIKKAVLEKFLDVRAFGAVIPISGKNEKKASGGDSDEEPEITDAKSHKSKKKQKVVSDVNFTGPVQFRMTKSLHKVEMEFIKGTGGFASGDDKGNKTFREESVLKYAMLATYGIIDNYNATKTGFDETDEVKILKALWHGTKNLTTRSKIGQMPRFMLIVTYKDDTFAGDLNNSIKVVSDKEEQAIRNLRDFKIDFTHLKNKLAKYTNNIEKIEYVSDYDFDQINQADYESSWKKIEV